MLSRPNGVPAARLARSVRGVGVCARDGEPTANEKEGHDAKNQQGLSRKVNDNGRQHLPPIPDDGTSPPMLLEEVADKGVVPAGDMLEEPGRERRGPRFGHTTPPLSFGIPFHRDVNTRCASRTSRRPLAVTRISFARPPRSAVGSPNREETRPFFSSRVSVAYNVASATHGRLSLRSLSRSARHRRRHPTS